MAPTRIDRELDAQLSGCYAHWGGDVVHERDAEQFHTDLPALASAVVTRFSVGVGRCRVCGKRVQGRHAERPLRRARRGRGPDRPVAKGWVAWTHYGLGLSLTKCAVLAGRVGVPVTSGAMC